jgi:hypothetical protein
VPGARPGRSPRCRRRRSGPVGRRGGQVGAVDRGCGASRHLRCERHGDVGQRRVLEAHPPAHEGVVGAAGLVVHGDGLVGLAVVAGGGDLMDGVVAGQQPVEAGLAVGVGGLGDPVNGEVHAGVRVVTGLVECQRHPAVTAAIATMPEQAWAGIDDAARPAKPPGQQPGDLLIADLTKQAHRQREIDHRSARTHSPSHRLTTPTPIPRHGQFPGAAADWCVHRPAHPPRRPRQRPRSRLGRPHPLLRPPPTAAEASGVRGKLPHHAPVTVDGNAAGHGDGR